jgi:hypothetical protein
MSQSAKMMYEKQQTAQSAPGAGDEAEYLLEVNSSETQRLRMQPDIVKDAMGGDLIAAPFDLSGTQLRILDSATADGKSLSTPLPPHHRL